MERDAIFDLLDMDNEIHHRLDDDARDSIITRRCTTLSHALFINDTMERVVEVQVMTVHPDNDIPEIHHPRCFQRSTTACTCKPSAICPIHSDTHIS